MLEVLLSGCEAMVCLVVSEVADGASVDVRVLLHVGGEVGGVLPASE